MKKRKNIFKKGIDKAGRVWYNVQVVRKTNAGMAQSVEHVIGNDEVISSILITSSKKAHLLPDVLFSVLLLYENNKKAKGKLFLPLALIFLKSCGKMSGR